MCVRFRFLPGFSTIELLTVVAIIGISAAIAIPVGLSYVRDYEATRVAQSVASQMQYARVQAVRRNSQNGMLLNLGYPNKDEFQFTSADRNPKTGGYDAFFPGPARAPSAPNNVDPPEPGMPSPHGPLIRLPAPYAFRAGTLSSLVFRFDGSVGEVNAEGVSSRFVSKDDQGYSVIIEYRDEKNPNPRLNRIVRISRNGRVVVERLPPPKAS